MVKVEFQFDTPYGKFLDAIYLPDDHTLTDADIQAMQEQRRDNWISIVAPPAIETPQE
jgi:hypothetical protein